MSTHEIFNQQAFRTFCEDSDFLKLSLWIHQAYEQHFDSADSFFETPLDLSSCFPLFNGTVLWPDQGVLIFIPVSMSAQLALVYSAGLHGNETAPIEMIRDLTVDLLQGKLGLAAPLLIQFGHFEAMIIHRRQIEENLNRCFDPAHGLSFNPRTQESVRAHRLKVTFDLFVSQYSRNLPLVHLDLHTAIRASVYERFAVLPYDKSDQCLNREVEQSLRNMGVEALLHSDRGSSTYSYYSKHVYGAQSFTLELGKVQPFGQNDHSRFSKANQELRRLCATGSWILPSTENNQTQELIHFDVVRTLVRNHEDFKLLFSEDLPNFTAFPKNTPLMQDGDKIFRSHNDSERVVFPNSKVAIGERAGLIVRPK
jgi:succinylglutamate desuccinylase